MDEVPGAGRVVNNIAAGAGGSMARSGSGPGIRRTDSGSSGSSFGPGPSVSRSGSGASQRSVGSMGSRVMGGVGGVVPASLQAGRGQG